MTVAPSTAKDPIEYRFADFRLVPATRELWREGERKHVQPLVFDCLVYLLEQRTRVVGRDELASAVWAKVDVGDQQIRQLVLRARQAIDDDAKEQRVIRTVSGGGYRWVMDVEMAASRADEDSAAVAVADQPVLIQPSPAHPSAADRPASASAEPAPSPVEAAYATTDVRPRRGSWKTHAILGAGLLGLLAVLLQAYVRRDAAVRVSASAASRQAVVVLPLEVDAPSEGDWVRLGAMDLIAQRMRGAGMPVSPSDGVVSAVHAVGEPADPKNEEKLRETLGAAMLVQGSAVKSSAGWKVELVATGADATRHTVETERPEAVDAARQATDMLLATLGRSPAPNSADERSPLQTLLQRARAALLANQLDTARSILAGAPQSMQSDPSLRMTLAQIEQRAGRHDAARASLTALLADPALQASPSLRARALTLLGFIDMGERNDCVGGERNFDAAVSALSDQPTALEAGDALSARGAARACLNRMDEAITDLSMAGPILDAAGDRIGLANLNNRFGLLEKYRRRPAEAVPYLQSASAIHQSFGAIGGLAADLAQLCMVQAELLQWSDALASSERLWALRSRVDDAGRLYAMAGLRAYALIGAGRHAEAAELLRSTEAAKPDVRGALTLTFHQAGALLAWRRGDAQRTIAEIDTAWTLLPPSQMSDDEDLSTILLRQRASIALGQPSQGDVDLGSLRAESPSDGGSPPVLLVARAEWAAQRGQAAEAEAAFRQAMAAAEAHAVPANVVLAADAYARWLLARQRPEDARGVAGRIVQWADRDYDSAVLQVAVLHALAQSDAWARALKRAQALAGERQIPAELLQAPAS
ncbi:winged helix-turn-helix domain-containing protein [Dokdonella sp.]|uniref:winged helix-turn-helix domain-containing protein n=1 Tax=Dokdonella sp. TaxID=2291710 RepID=UPI001B1001BB|nr:winged helix-turn-helix domain-containing protein [Dokdonella sp.]MBO9664220.1 winged helix-turn-helix domain-containing protein [Dokdonella sp.]